MRCDPQSIKGGGSKAEVTVATKAKEQAENDPATWVEINSRARPGVPKVETNEGQDLGAELRSLIRGEVRFDNGSRALYSTDASNYRQIPIGVVIPRDIDDVIKTIAACRHHNAPILSRGGGTSLAGQCCNVAVVMDFSKYLNRVLEIDPQRKLARVEPGCILDNLREATEKNQLTFGPDPATHSHNTLGGMIGNDSCGIHSILAANEGDGARTADNIAELEILLYDGMRMRVGATREAELERIIDEGGRKGEIYSRLKALRDKYADRIRARFPRIPRRVSGFNLPYLLPEYGFNVARALVGSEGTCVTVLEATVNLVNSPPARTLLVLGYPDVYSAGDHVPEILKHKPTGLEGLDHLLIEYMKKKGMHPTNIKLLPEGKGWLLVEFGGENKEESDDKARRLMEELTRKTNPPTMKLFDDPLEEHLVWQVRESGLGATANVPGEPPTYPGWEDSAVPPDKVGKYLRELRKLFSKYEFEASLYGHFGQGCIHCRIPFDLRTRSGILTFRSFLDEAAELVVSLGGSISGEHGDGQARAELLPKMFGKELVEAFREFKAIFDPLNKMNPGKVVDPYKIIENLRTGPDYNPRQVTTHFKFPDDNGAFSNATLRCVGVGKCRREAGGVMCPSYMVTHEENHSTRGRARLLFEMLEGDVIHDGWKSEAVKDALDLCLACKGCKGDCPVNVDMATYKAEFLSHYYEGRLRPRQAYAFGYVYYWARIGSLLPLVTNFVTEMPVLRQVAKLISGIADQRSIPKFAPQTFKHWFAARDRQNGHNRGAAVRPQVILWADTFNNHFHPTTAQAAVEVLEAAGFRVKVPLANLCCGRPLYDYGFLDKAKTWLRNIMLTLHDEIEAGTSIVVLEPSCASVFRDELLNLFPTDEDAKRLSKQTFLLSEFLVRQATDFQSPKLNRKALVQGHCHHRSIMKMTDEETVLSKMSVDYESLDSGCCGMAGAFGFEAGDHYDLAIKAGERALLPKVREAEKTTLVIADGFSCREQIAQTTNRHALHLAQVIQMALHEGEERAEGDFPESSYLQMPTPVREKFKTLALLGAGALLLGGVIWFGLSKSRNASVSGE
jgi:FAD/FMN-containing dehydrogenase/Fe-S oxidoreductase